MRMKWSGSISLLSSLFLACGTPPSVIRDCPVGAGVISGYVRYEANLPETRTIATQDPACSKSMELVRVRDKRLADVIVYLEGAGGCASVDLPEVVVEVRGCLLPPCIVLRSGQVLRVVNLDSSVHAFRFEFEDGASNLYILKQGEQFQWRRSTQALGSLVCGVHPWSRSMVGVFAHPFYAVTDSRGAYELRGLQNGSYTLKAVHQRLGVASAQVDLKDTLKHVFEDAEFQEQW